MKWIVGLSLLALGVTDACRKDPVPAYQAWAKAACACEDKACAERSKKELGELNHRWRENLIQKETRAAMNEGEACIKKYGVAAK